MLIDDADVPLEIQLESVQVEVIPRSLMGVLAHFKSKRIAALAGRLVLASGESREPLASAHLSATMAGTAVESSTGLDGEFYLEDVVPGTLRIHARNASIECHAAIQVTDPPPTFTDAGDVPCEP